MDLTLEFSAPPPALEGSIARVKQVTAVGLRLLIMSIPWDSGLGDAFQNYIMTFQSFNPASDPYSDIEAAKIAIADALLEAIGAPVSFSVEPVGYSYARNNSSPRAIRKRKKWGCKVVSRVLQRFGAYCQRCACEDDLVLDHIVPISLGGQDSEENLQPLCWKCNSRKGARL